MTNINHNELINEFIKNEEDWISRSENLASIKKARQEKEKRRMQHKKNVEFLIYIAVAVLIITTAIISVICAFSTVLPKNINYYESRYDITYQTHIVSEGETLNGISKDILRTHPEINDKVGRWNYDDLLVKINDLDNPNRIYPGQEIIYPVF